MNNKAGRYFIILELIFVSVLVAVSAIADFSIPSDPLTLALFVLASFRMARTLSYNEIAEPLRSLFTVCEPDSCKAGMSVRPIGTGLQYAIGSLLTCPICTGTWSALALFVLWNLVPGFGTALLWVLAVAGGSEVVHWWAEHQEWAGRAQRCIAGDISPDDN